MVIKEAVLGIVRHFLTTFGGAFVATGSVSHDEVSQVAGGLSILVGVIWSALSKRK